MVGQEADNRISYLLSIFFSSHQLQQLQQLKPTLLNTSDKNKFISKLIKKCKEIDHNDTDYLPLIVKTSRSFMRWMVLMKLATKIVSLKSSSYNLKKKDHYLLALSFSIRPLLTKIYSEKLEYESAVGLSQIIISLLLTITDFGKEYAAIWIIFKMLTNSKYKFPGSTNYKVAFPIIFSYLFSDFWLNNDFSPSYVSKSFEFMWRDLLPISRNEHAKLDYNLENVVELLSVSKNRRFISSLISETPKAVTQQYIRSNKFTEVALMQIGSPKNNTTYQNIINPMNLSILPNLLKLIPKYFKVVSILLPVFLVVNRSLIHKRTTKDNDEEKAGFKQSDWKCWIKESLKMAINFSTFVFLSTVPSCFLLRKFIDFPIPKSLNMKIIGFISGLFTVWTHERLPKDMKLSDGFFRGMTIYLIRTAILYKFRYLKYCYPNLGLKALEQLVWFGVSLALFRLKDAKNLQNINIIKFVKNVDKGFGVLGI